MKYQSPISPAGRIIGFLMLLGLTTAPLPAQPNPPLTLPQASPAAELTQQVGLAEITIKYHSPGVKGREIWGKLVPYDGGKPFPWRAGANENTTITFSDDVSIEGQPLPAGTYGLHMIPSPTEWIIIFNKDNTSWGSFFYREDQDALRVKVTPVAADFQERLSYGFEDMTDNSAVIYLRWEKLKVPCKVQFDGHAIVVESIGRELRSLQGFFWQSYMQAANYCIQNDTHLDQGMAWIEESIRRNENAGNLLVKAQLLEKTGKAAEAKPISERAIKIATEAELNSYGYQLMGQKRVKDAIEIFQMNVKRHPDSWNVYDSLGEALRAGGENAGAIENYKKALQMAPEGQKERIQSILNQLAS